MKKIIMIISSVCFVYNLQAQQIENKVIASGGKKSTAGNITLEYTVGEVFTRTLSSANNCITQGFHQPVITLARMLNDQDTSDTPANEMLSGSRTATESGNYIINIFPNPATDFINIKMNRQVESRCFMLISDIQGKAISARELTDMETTFPCNNLPAGKYIITLKSEDGLLNESFKMVKAE
jgi:hypothetical protein